MLVTRGGPVYRIADIHSSNVCVMRPIKQLLRNAFRIIFEVVKVIIIIEIDHSVFDGAPVLLGLYFLLFFLLYFRSHSLSRRGKSKDRLQLDTSTKETQHNLHNKERQHSNAEETYQTGISNSNPNRNQRKGDKISHFLRIILHLTTNVILMALIFYIDINVFGRMPAVLVLFTLFLLSERIFKILKRPIPWRRPQTNHYLSSYTKRRKGDMIHHILRIALHLIATAMTMSLIFFVDINVFGRTPVVLTIYTLLHLSERLFSKFRYS